MKSLPWIYVDPKTSRYAINPDIHRLLTETELADEELGVISVVGRARTGKSFLLNRGVLGLGAEKDAGFQVSPTVNSCTKGLWMYPAAVRLSPQGSPLKCPRVLVVDSEGLSSTDSSASHDTHVFALTLLLSSLFLYNTQGNINEAAIADLGVVTDVIQQVGATEADMPYFLWVVRDFTLQLKQRKGEGSMTENEYLEQELNTGDSNAGCRALVQRYFPRRSCLTLVRPCASETDLQRMSSLPDRRVRKAFLKGMQSLRERLARHAGAKQVRGSAATGRLIAALAQAYVDKINGGDFPEMSDALPLVTAARDRRLAEALRGALEAAIGEVEQDDQLPTTAIQEAADKCVRKWMSGRSDEHADPRGLEAELRSRADAATAAIDLSRTEARLRARAGPDEDTVRDLLQGGDAWLSERLASLADKCGEGAWRWRMASEAAVQQESRHRKARSDLAEARVREEALRAAVKDSKDDAKDRGHTDAVLRERLSSAEAQVTALERCHDVLLDRAVRCEADAAVLRSARGEARARYREVLAKAEELAEEVRVLRARETAHVEAETRLRAALEAADEARRDAEARGERLEAERRKMRGQLHRRAEDLYREVREDPGASKEEEERHHQVLSDFSALLAVSASQDRSRE